VQKKVTAMYHTTWPSCWFHIFRNNTFNIYWRDSCDIQWRDPPQILSLYHQWLVFP